MKILEVKNNLVKISHTASDNLGLAKFVIIEDANNPYVAQVMSLKADSGLNYAIVKLLFTFDDEGVVKNYNGTVPEMDADITLLSSNELLDILPIDEPLKIGKIAQQNFLLNIDYSSLEKIFLICSDKTENTDILLSNFAKQITSNNNKSVILDTDASINAENTLVFGKDFKLPLNYDTINFIYENDLNDVEPSSKAVIQDIFLEVQEYSKTVLDHFIPFDNFITVVEAQYRETGSPELALLKSRLLKYRDENVFAQSAKEFQTLRSSIRANMSTLIDISRAESVLQKQIINYVYDEINTMDLFVYSMVKINNDNADKKLIRKFLAQDKIYTTITAPHNYKYIFELKERASNMILFAPQTMQHDFASYNVFLNKLNDDECIVFGKATQNIPLIVEVMSLEDLDEAIVPEEAPVKEPEHTETIPSQDAFSEDTDSYSYESMQEDTTIANTEVSTDETREVSTEPPAEIEQQPVNIEQSEVVSLSEEINESAVSNEEKNIVPAQTQDNLEQPEENTDIQPEDDDLSEYTLPDEEPDSEQYIEEEASGFEDENLEGREAFSEEIEENIVEDEVFEDDTLPEIDEIKDEDVEEADVEDNLTEDDLDYIQDANNPNDEFEQEPYEGIEHDKPPVVPIYPAEEMSVNPNAAVYNAGDQVSHPKYGVGVVEKIIKYGNKELCSINFEGGRRLLDPAMSEIQKV